MSPRNALAVLKEPGILTPVQWYQGAHIDDPQFQAAKRLMLAVLLDSLKCLQTCAPCRTVVQCQMLAEAEAWIADRNGRGPFAFASVCETLGINPHRLRDGLGEWRRQGLSGTGPQRQVRQVSNRRWGTIASPVRRRRRRAKEAGSV
jgi:hypothetical protein